jgi:hypothetical protein
MVSGRTRQDLALAIAYFVLGGAIRTKQWASSHHHGRSHLRVRESQRIFTIIPRKETLQPTNAIIMIVRLPWHQHQPQALSLTGIPFLDTTTRIACGIATWQRETDSMRSAAAH